jgi:cytochrome oxidase Cu insertion factor (SCO1/SenC/PrrC family)
MNSSGVVNTNKSRKKLIVVLLIFIVPAVAAVLLYASGWHPSATVNHGELIVPARPVEDRLMQTIDGKPVKFSELYGKWTMVYFDKAACPDECISRLYFMRQIHASQGKDYDRLQRVFIVTDAAAAENLMPKLADYPDMKVWTATKAELSLLSRNFGLDAQADGTERNVFLMDPQGNLMMRYKPGIEPAGMRKDIERLLKYSSENSPAAKSQN